MKDNYSRSEFNNPPPSEEGKKAWMEFRAADNRRAYNATEGNSAEWPEGTSDRIRLLADQLTPRERGTGRVIGVYPDIETVLSRTPEQLDVLRKAESATTARIDTLVASTSLAQRTTAAMTFVESNKITGLPLRRRVAPRTPASTPRRRQTA